MLISLVVPVFNEEATILIFYNRVRSHQEFKHYDVEILFVNDGSRDTTEHIINTLKINDSFLKVINFTRNFGKEAALMAGLEYATGDVVIPIDVDLQDPLEVINLMLNKFKNGADIVLAKRIDRSSDTIIKRLTASLFYKTHNLISYPKIEENVGDFRLISRKYVDHIKNMPEKNLFMKGVLSWVGGKVDIVEYVREERIAGKTKFNGWKLWNLALEGFINFSTLPLRIWTYIGFFMALISFLYGIWMICQTIVWGSDVKGYPSLLVSILFLGGIQLMGIGILGEYLGRVYMEVKNRPRYIIKDIEN
ncbi:CPS-53 prophage, bactoprenol glucosyl transferase [Acinetobacter baumannii]|uniref:glycosyltransferase family 2 protein n=1 Tax=Acinetobacter baumannii TaxID=470 RepID=UPI000DE641FB|nr:glycosyltransferase family 2 protein [Acinetobacter baumannii]MBJ9578241.1 glycosyltransferase family 2 protein [Acinetobacter baumannii]SSS46803.1 CPS-53 prophage, bactoprenol glucosyl transferase [Acinetobacter baumannii]